MLVSNSHKKDKEEMQTRITADIARLKSAKEVAEKKEAAKRRSQQAVVQTVAAVEEAEETPSVHVLMRSLVGISVANGDGTVVNHDQDEDVPAHILALVIAKLEENILATILNKSTPSSEGGHDDLFIPDHCAKKSNLTIRAEPASAKVVLYFFGRISMVPAKNAIALRKARALKCQFRF